MCVRRFTRQQDNCITCFQLLKKITLRFIIHQPGDKIGAMYEKICAYLYFLSSLRHPCWDPRGLMGWLASYTCPAVNTHTDVSLRTRVKWLAYTCTGDLGRYAQVRISGVRAGLLVASRYFLHQGRYAQVGISGVRAGLLVASRYFLHQGRYAQVGISGVRAGLPVVSRYFLLSHAGMRSSCLQSLRLLHTAPTRPRFNFLISVVYICTCVCCFVIIKG
jgi:hypothetical protein